MKNIFLLLIPLLLLSCSKGGNDWRCEIYLDEATESVKFDDLFSEERRITLENHPDAYFHDYSTVKWAADRIYVYDAASNEKNIIVFDIDGNFIGRVGKYGPGPEEYSSVCDFTVDERNGNIIILSAGSQIYIYNSEGGFLGKRKISDARLIQIERIKDGFLASVSETEAIENDSTFLFYRFDNDFNPVAAKFKPDKEDNFITNNGTQISIVNGNGLIFNNFPGKVYLYDCKEDTAGYYYRFKLPMQLTWEENQDFMAFENALINHCWTDKFHTNSKLALISYKGKDGKTHTVALNNHNLHLINIAQESIPHRLITTNDKFISIEDKADDSNFDLVILKVN